MPNKILTILADKTLDEVWNIFKNKVLDAIDQAISSKLINNQKETTTLDNKRNKISDQET